MSYGYDGAGRPNAVTGYVSAVGYHPHGAAYRTVLGNLVEEKTLYDGRLQPYLLEATKTSSLWKLENFYCPDQQSSCGSNNGNVMSQRLTAPKRQDAGGGLLTLSTAYGYDAANRLNSATESGSGSGWNQAFTYDQYGNQEMTQTPLDLGPITLHCPSYNGTNNRCTGAFQYDNGVSGGPGNITAFPGGRTAAYDAENRQIALTDGGTWQYFYDGEGRRVKKVGGSRTVVYVYDGMGQLAAEYDSAPPEPAPCATCYLTVDHLGSTRLMTDASGVPQRRYDYLPFGWDIQSGYGNRSTVAGYVVSDKVNPKFTGKERDYETGLDLDYFGARYYSGAQGRFTTADWSATPQPVPYAKFDDPQTLNLYAYVRNNPLSRVDLDGHGDCRTSLKGCTSRGSHASGTAPAVGAPGTQLVHDANVRGGYTARAQGALTEKGQWSPVREGAKVEARAAQSGIADGVVAISVKNSEGVTRGLTATTTNPAVNALAEGMRPAGQALVVTGVAVSIYNVASAPEGERGREAAGEAVSWAAGLGGAWAVGKLGAAGGSFFGPWGTAIGGVGGAIVGGFFGGKAGHDVGTQAYDEINRPNH